MNEKTAIYCKTKGEARKVLGVLVKKGIHKKGVGQLGDWGHYPNFCLSCYNQGWHKKETYENWGYKIIPADQFLKENGIFKNNGLRKLILT